MSRFKVGDRVQVKPHLKRGVIIEGEERPRVPEWATKGTVTSIPGPNSDHYLMPRVRWDSDLKQRHVPESWLKPLADRNYIRVVCGCKRVVRMSPSTYEEGGVICDLCKTAFKAE